MSGHSRRKIQIPRILGQGGWDWKGKAEIVKPRPGRSSYTASTDPLPSSSPSPSSFQVFSINLTPLSALCIVRRTLYCCAGHPNECQEGEKILLLSQHIYAPHICTWKSIDNIVNLHNYSENFLWVISPVIEEFLNTRKCILHYWGRLVKSIDMSVLHLMVFCIILKNGLQFL